MKLDVLAFGVHPDDVELGCGGALMGALSEGKKVGIVDLTRGELGTRGTVESRKKESEDAAAVLGLSVRENLEMRDGFFVNDETHQLKVIACIRRYRPDIVIGNAPADRHPDHGRASVLVRESCFYAGLAKIRTQHNGLEQDAWRPKNVFYYIQDRLLEPDFLIDISPYFEKKIEAVKAYRTQFHNPDIMGPQTYISTPEFFDTWISRHKIWGKTIGVSYAEGFLTDNLPGIRSLYDIIHITT